MPEVVRCPGCDYDLSGIVESWGDAWPLSGVCPECGGAFPWSEVIEARNRPPPWSFEHAPRPSLHRAFATLARLAEPVSFWWSMRSSRTSSPGRVAMLLGAVAGGGVLLASAAAAWTVLALRPSVSLPITIPSLLADSYGTHAREAATYLALWHLAGAAGAAPFAIRRRGFGRALASALLYAAVTLSAVWSLLAVALIADVYRFGAFGVAGRAEEVVSVLCILLAWAWQMAMWYGLVRWRLPVRRHTLAWLASQASASAAVLAFGVIDAYFLPF